MTDPDVVSLCQEFSVRIIDPRRYPDVGETRAPGTIGRIIAKRGMPHARLVMSTLAESANNKVAIDETGLWATSDLVLAYGDVIERDSEAWFRVWDRTPVGMLQWGVYQRLSGIVNQRAALAGQIHERLFERFDRDYRQPELGLER